MSELLRVYLDPAEICRAPQYDGYPFAWFTGDVPIKVLVREQAGYRCVRCQHPYPPGISELHPRGEWTPCDELCTHEGPVQVIWEDGVEIQPGRLHNLGTTPVGEAIAGGGHVIEAHWRILTTHHLNGVKHDCRWWNLAALCQRCHLEIQGRVVMERVWPWEHSEWFKPYAAGWYAVAYLGLELSREETMERLDELLALEHQHGWQRIGR